MSEERIEVPLKTGPNLPKPISETDPILWQIRHFTVELRSLYKHKHNLPGFESSRASDKSLHLDSMVEECAQALKPIFDTYIEKASSWYESKEAEQIKSTLVFDYREELQPDGTIKATGRPAYPPSKASERRKAQSVIDEMDKNDLAKLLMAELEKRKAQ